jgi:hypothetical protein
MVCEDHAVFFVISKLICTFAPEYAINLYQTKELNVNSTYFK